MSKRNNRSNRTTHEPTAVPGSSARSGGVSVIPGALRGNTPLQDLQDVDYGPGSNGIKFRDVLNELNAGQTDLNQLLAALLGAGNNKFTDERWDMLYQYLLGMMSQANQRDFDIQQRDESRLYNNPQNQLARLLGAGISRDAAIQILSGSAGGSGVGSGVIGSGANPFTSAPTGISGTQDLARIHTGANVVYGAVDTLNNLLQSGMSMAQGIEQTRALNMLNQFTQQQLQSFNSVNQITQALQVLQSSGQIESADFEKISNVNDLNKFLQKLAPDNEQLQQLIKSPAYHNAFGTQFGRDYMNKYMASLRDSRDAGTLFDEFLKQTKLATSLRELDIAKVGAEFENINADTYFKNEQVKEIMSRITLNEATTQYTIAETELLGLQAEQQELTNANLRMEYELNSSGFPMLKQIYLEQLSDTLAYWSTINDPQVRSEREQAWFHVERNANLAAYMEHIRLNAVGDFYEANPTMYRLMVAWHASGAADEFHKTEEFAKYFNRFGKSVFNQ